MVGAEKFRSFLIVALLFLQGCSTDSHNTEKTTLKATPQALSVCEVVKNIEQNDGRTLTVRGMIEGFHEIRLVDPKCPDTLQVAMSYEQRGRLIAKRTRLGCRAPNLDGILVVRGRIEKGKGKLYFNERLLDPASPGEGKPMTVDLITPVEILDYSPNLKVNCNQDHDR